MNCRHLFSVVIGLALAVPSLGQESSKEWNSFQNGGLLNCDAKLPTTWSSTQGVIWEFPVHGYGQSTPIVHGDHAYVTSVSGDKKQQVHVQAISLTSGEALWRYDADNSVPEENNIYVSRAAATPVCDEAGVIAFFEGGNLVALDHDGNLRWQHDLVSEFGDVKARHSLAGSLEQNDRHVFVWIERMESPYVLALDKSDGKIVWNVAGVGSTSWGSPRLIPVGDSHHLVLSASGKIAGLDPDTGQRLWEFDEISGNSTPTPVPVGDGRFAIGASPGRGSNSGNAKSNGVVEIVKTDDGFKASWVWQATKASSSFGSPLVSDGRVWFVNRQGVVYCLDADSGELVFSQRSEAGSVWATPIANPEHVFLFGKDGMTHVLRNVPRFEEVTLNALWESESTEGQNRPGGNPVLYAGVPVGESLLIRRGDRLYRVGNSTGGN